MASRLPASVRQSLPYCSIDRTKSACMESRQGEFSAASMVESLSLALKGFTSSAISSWRLVDSNVAAEIACKTKGRPVSDIVVNSSRHLFNVCWCMSGNQLWYSSNQRRQLRTRFDLHSKISMESTLRVRCRGSPSRLRGVNERMPAIEDSETKWFPVSEPFESDGSTFEKWYAPWASSEDCATCMLELCVPGVVFASTIVTRCSSRTLALVNKLLPQGTWSTYSVFLPTVRRIRREYPVYGRWVDTRT